MTLDGWIEKTKFHCGDSKIMRTYEAFWRDTLVTSLRDISAGEQMLKKKLIQRQWPQCSIVVKGIHVSRRRVGDIIHVLGGMDAPW